MLSRMLSSRTGGRIVLVVFVVPRSQHLPDHAGATESVLDAGPGVFDLIPIEEKPHVAGIGLAHDPRYELILSGGVRTRQRTAKLGDRHAEVPKKIGHGVRLSKALARRR